MENKSKQIIFSIVGVAILIVLVAGVSFAFFTYSRTGGKNNALTTGKINFKYQDTNAIELTNQFPATTEKGKLNEAFTFTVSGSIPAGANPVNYTVYAIQGTSKEGKTRMSDDDIRVFVEQTGTGQIEGSYGSDDGAIAGDSATGFVIATGTLNAGSSINDQYSVKIWVDGDTLISDTDPEANYCASADECLGGRPIFSQTYYSLKIKVEANDSV